MTLPFPFGLRSAPKIFSALADGLLWILNSKGWDQSLNYLDDFLLLGPPASPKCAEALHSFLAFCNQLGVPVVKEKTEGPSTSLSFLGIQIDTKSLQLRLPEDKLRNLVTLLGKWMQDSPTLSPQRSGTKRDLLSLICLLSHAASVVKPDRTFIHSLIDESVSVKALDHHIHLSAKARADIAWWYTLSCSHGMGSHSSQPQSHHTKYGQMCQAHGGAGRPETANGSRPSGHLLGSQLP